MAKLFLPARQKRVCFSNPISGRRWLNLLDAHPRFGLEFKPNLNFPAEVLGFSFATNRHGLRGPANAAAPGVILGTSFGMGLSVDNGSNWYDLLLDPERWFNGAMPVGIRNHVNLLDDLYRGSYDTLLYLYHPNIWKASQSFESAAQTGRNIFQTMGWKTGLRETLLFYPKWMTRECYKARDGLSVHSRWNGQDFHFNARYAMIELKRNRDFAAAQMALLNQIFGRFTTVVAVRAPIKEDIAGSRGFTPLLEALAAHNNEWWSFFTANTASHVRSFRLPDNEFVSVDFLPYDTHWSASGNRKFVELLRPILIDLNVDGVRPG
jgi:hypothetical protein